MGLLKRASRPASSKRDVGTAEMLKQSLHHPNSAHLNSQVFEIVEQRTYLQHGVEVGPGDTVLDVGGNVGVAAAFFAVECGAGVVHSFEPIAPIFDVLRENLRQFPACIPHNFGLSDSRRSDTITFYPKVWAMSGAYADPGDDRENLRLALRNLGASEESVLENTRDLFDPVTVPCEFRTVTDVLRSESIDRVDLLKLDVEKAELDVLAGIDESDWPSVRQVAGELHVDEEQRDELVRTLRDRDFRVTVVQEPFMEGTEVFLFYAVRKAHPWSRILRR
jgi:FkbM family methyltransferase